jgi:TRAP-type C4-dicarboxylate transport system substrate-binding protein
VLKTRVAENYDRMRENGVTIDEDPPQPVMKELAAAAKSTLAEWKEKAGPEAAKVLDDFLAGK